MVPPESAAAVRKVVAAEQQQLRADGPARLAQLHREQPAPDPRELLREEQAFGDEAEERRSRGLRAHRQRSSARRAGGSAARVAEAGSRDLESDAGIHRASSFTTQSASKRA